MTHKQGTIPQKHGTEFLESTLLVVGPWINTEMSTMGRCRRFIKNGKRTPGPADGRDPYTELLGVPGQRCQLAGRSGALLVF